MKISFTIITFNSEPVLERALESIKTAACEIIVVDSGSTDGTQKIAKKYTSKIFHRTFENDYAAQKNYALSKATGDWIFSLDSDEVISPELHQTLPHLTDDNTVDGYWFRRRNYISSDRYLKYGLFYPDWQLRLFRNNKNIIYQNPVHESLTISNINTKEIKSDIYHFPQRPKYASFSNINNLTKYSNIHCMYLIKRNKSKRYYFIYAIKSFIVLFMAGYFRGKGFLDGWAGFRAHILFSASISYGYYLAYRRM